MEAEAVDVVEYVFQLEVEEPLTKVEEEAENLGPVPGINMSAMMAAVLQFFSQMSQMSPEITVTKTITNTIRNGIALGTNIIAVIENINVIISIVIKNIISDGANLSTDVTNVHKTVFNCSFFIPCSSTG